MADELSWALLGVAIAEGAGLGVLAWWVRTHEHKTERTAPPTAGPAPSRSLPRPPTGEIEDVFLLHRSGLLLKHYTRRLRPTMDSDVLSGMLVAVQEFIKDSFRGEAGDLDEVRFGDLRIKLLEGKWTLLAALIRGRSSADHKAQMVSALKDLENRYEDLLIDWDGTMDKIPEVDRIMMRLIEGGYGAPERTT